MSGVAYRNTLDDAGAVAALQGLRLSGTDLRPLLEDIGAELESSTLMRFDTNVAPDGTPWIPSRRASAAGGRTLVEHGYLRDSVHYRVDGDNAVEVGEGGIAAAYAAAHQFGFDGEIQVRAHDRKFTMVFGRPARGVAHVKAHTMHMRLPARPSLGLSADDQVAIGKIVVDHWVRAGSPS